MSDYVRYNGKIEFVLSGKEDIELYAKKVCQEKNIEKASYNKDYTEQLKDSLYEEYIVISDSLYHFIQLDYYDEYEDIFDAREENDGTISFCTQFYNGGCSLPEALEIALKNSKELKDGTRKVDAENEPD